MSKILVDTSVWIEYFGGNETVNDIDNLIDENVICTNKIILCELIPFLIKENEIELVELLESIDEIPLKIDWNKIIDYQTLNVKNNLRKIGIPDLLILENIIQNDLPIYTLDKHFTNMKNIHQIKTYK